MKQSARTANRLLFSLAFLMASAVIFLTYHISDGVPLPLFPGTYRTDMTLVDRANETTTKIVYFTIATFTLYFLAQGLRKNNEMAWRSSVIFMSLLGLIGLLTIKADPLSGIFLVAYSTITLIPLSTCAPVVPQDSNLKCEQTRTNFSFPKE